SGYRRRAARLQPPGAALRAPERSAAGRRTVPVCSPSVSAASCPAAAAQAYLPTRMPARARERVPAPPSACWRRDSPEVWRLPPSWRGLRVLEGGRVSLKILIPFSERVEEGVRTFSLRARHLIAVQSAGYVVPAKSLLDRLARVSAR